MRWLVLLALISACPGCDEEDDDCDESKLSLSLETDDTTWWEYPGLTDYALGPMPTAVWGEQRYDAGVFTDCGDPRPGSPVMVTSTSPDLIAAAAAGTTITLDAKAAGDTTLAVVAANGMRTALIVHADAIASVALVSDEPGATDAFLRGMPYARIVLLSATGVPLVDDRLAVAGGDLARGEHWNWLEIGDAPAGDHALDVLAGGGRWPVTARIVDSIDALVPDDAAITAPSDITVQVCFHATLAGQRVAGVPYQLDAVNGRDDQTAQTSCIDIYQPDGGGPTTIVTAHALGLTATAVVTWRSS